MQINNNHSKIMTNLKKLATSILIIVTVASLFLTIKEFNAFSFDDITDTSHLNNLIKINIALLVILSLIMLGTLYNSYQAQKKKIPGSIIKFRLSIILGFFAALPAIAIALLVGVYLNLSLQSWFNKRISTAVDESSLVADAYLQEHQQTILNDATYLSREISSFLQELIKRRSGFNSNNLLMLQNLRGYMSRKALDKNITETVIVDETGNVLARSNQTLIFGQIEIAPEAFEQSSQGSAVLVLDNDNTRRVRALIKLSPLFDSILQNKTYMLVGRPIDSKVLQHIKKTAEASAEYNILEEKRHELQNMLTALYIIIASLFVLCALWIGTIIAKRIAKPVVALITAASDVAAGNLKARVKVKDTQDEMSMLGDTFNLMTEKIEQQQHSLRTTNEELDERRQFIEAVMIGVSAGVMSIDNQGKISFINPQAEKLLGLDASSIGKQLGDVVPEFKELPQMEPSAQPHPQEILIHRNNSTRTLQTQVVAEDIDEKILGFIITFDDITNLQTAERKAAWSGVARRIAHEIKNPLTPIQLSAERLRRKYSSQIHDDSETFSLCLDTIIRQVDQIGRLVSEFSSFARLPDPVLKEENINEIVHQTFALESQRNPAANFHLELPDEPVFAYIDHGLLTQVIVNLLKNATEAAMEHNPKQGDVAISLQDDAQHFTLIIEDSGKGFPVQNRERILEPYVTTKKEGTGLGLAIVQKVTADHQGNISLGDSEKFGGAKLSLIFPKNSRI